MGAETDNTSEFNMAVSFLYTLRTLLNMCADSSASLNYHTWFHVLLAIRREISDDMTSEQFKKANEFKESLAPIVQNLTTKMNKGMYVGIPSELYDGLDSFEIFLREIISRKGYKGRMLSSAGKALKA